MELQKALTNLEEYINLDKTLRSSNKEEWNDFDKFCDSHCEDIVTVLHYIKEESIPKAVLKEKIKEKENKAYGNDANSEKLKWSDFDLLLFQRDILQEILTKGE